MWIPLQPLTPSLVCVPDVVTDRITEVKNFKKALSRLGNGHVDRCSTMCPSPRSADSTKSWERFFFFREGGAIRIMATEAH